MQMKKMANPVAFVGFFRRSKPLAALAPLLCVWELGSREFLPAQQYRRLKYGWTLREQANMMLAYQVRKFVHLSSEDKGDHFKTGSGQAQGKQHSKRDDGFSTRSASLRILLFCRGCSVG
jgi:hypothetical protein